MATFYCNFHRYHRGTDAVSSLFLFQLKSEKNAENVPSKSHFFLQKMFGVESCVDNGQWRQIDTALSLREGQLGSKCLGRAVIL